MTIALCLYLGFWRASKPVKPVSTASPWRIAGVLFGAVGLLCLLVWGTARPGLMWTLYALIPLAAIVFAMRAKMKKQAVWLAMLSLSTSISAVVGQMVSGLTLVIKDHVDSSVFGWAFPTEFFPGIFSGFIILFALLIGKLTGKKAGVLHYDKVFTIGVSLVALALAIIGFALSHSGDAKIPAWVIIISYAFKAAAEALIIPLALSLMHDISTKEDKSLTMAIWFLGAGLGVNMAKMLGIAMGKGALELGTFFQYEALAAVVLALVLWLISPWLARTVDEIKAMRADPGPPV